MERKPYSTPNLTVHGAIEDITEMPPKTPAGGDGKGAHPYGKGRRAPDSPDGIDPDSWS